MSDNAGTADDNDRPTEALAGMTTCNGGYYPPKPRSGEMHSRPTGRIYRGRVDSGAGSEKRKSAPSIFVALPSMVVFAGIAAFFGWVSAEPFWMSVGHSVHGTVNVRECAQPGELCEGVFRPANGAEPIPGVRITGDTTAKIAGETLSAQAASMRAQTVYVGNDVGLWWRGMSGLTLVLLCGLAVAAVSGAWRWRGRFRFLAVVSSMAGPLLLWLGALALTW